MTVDGRGAGSSTAWTWSRIHEDICLRCGIGRSMSLKAEEESVSKSDGCTGEKVIVCREQKGGDGGSHEL
jgi:hypothetical protein